MGVGSRNVRGAEIEVVQARDLGTAVQVVALNEPLCLLDVVKELHRKAQGVDDAHRLSDPLRARALRNPAHRASQAGEVAFGPVDIVGCADAVGDVVQSSDVTPAQHEGMVGQFIRAAQTERSGVLVLHVEAEHVHPEPPCLDDVGDDKLGVSGPDDIGGGGGAHAKTPVPNRGVCTSPSATCTILLSV